MTVTIFMVSLCGAMFVGMPVAFALLVCAVSLMVYLISVGTLDTFNTQIMAQYLISGADNFPLMAIPFFMLAGEIMTRGGISQQIVKIANTLVGHVRGGLGYVAIMAGLVLASISGSAAADTAALAAVVIPLMRDAKYNVPRSAGLIAGAGCIAPILPPAMPLVLFGVVSQLSITKLFFTGIFPGLLMATSLVITWRFVARKDFKEAPKQKFAFGPLLKALREGIWALSLPVIILGGMKTGAFTPTEAAVVAAVMALLISLFVYKGLKLRDLPQYPAHRGQDLLGDHADRRRVDGRRLADHHRRDPGAGDGDDAAVHAQQDAADGRADAAGVRRRRSRSTSPRRC